MQQSTLPPFRALVLAGFSANALFISFAFLLNRTWLAVSLLGGFALAMLVYGILYAVVGRGLAAPARPRRRTGKLLPANFLPLMIGKLLAVGTAVYLLIGVLHVAALWMLVGFLLAQVGVTAAVMTRFRTTKVTD